MDVLRADNCTKWMKFAQISSPKADVHNSNAHTKFGENPLMFSKVIIQKSIYRRVVGRNLPIRNPIADLHNINAHTKFCENPLTITQVIIRKQKYGHMYDKWMDRQMDVHVAGYKKSPASPSQPSAPQTRGLSRIRFLKGNSCTFRN